MQQILCIVLKTSILSLIEGFIKSFIFVLSIFGLQAADREMELMTFYRNPSEFQWSCKIFLILED